MIFESVLDILTAHKIGQTRLKLKKFLESEILGKRVIWLLDGFDEVNKNKEGIIEFINNLRNDGYKFVLTSRPYERESQLITRNIYNIVLLEIDDIVPYLRNFYITVAKAQGYSPIQKWVSKKIISVVSNINRHPRLLTISRIPLILTFLAILGIHELTTAQLPSSEFEIFKLFIEQLLMHVELERFNRDTNSILPEINNVDEVREILRWGFYFVSLHLFTNAKTNSGNSSFYNVKQGLAEKLTLNS